MSIDRITLSHVRVPLVEPFRISNGVVAEEGLAHEVLTRPRHPLTARFLQVMSADVLEQRA